MKTVNEFWGFLALILLVAIAWSAHDKKRSFNSAGHEIDSSVSITETIDTIISNPELAVVSVKTIRDTFWKHSPVDTSKIIAEFFAKRIYQRTYKDSLTEVSISDTVFRNQLQPGQMFVKTQNRIIEKTIRITEKIQPDKAISMGAGMFSVGRNTGISLGLGYTGNDMGIQTHLLLGKSKGLMFSIHKNILKIRS